MPEEELRQEIQSLRQRQAELEYRLLQIEERQERSGLFQYKPVFTPFGKKLSKDHSGPLNESVNEPSELQAPPKQKQLIQNTKIEQLLGLQGFSWLGILALMTGLGLFIRYAYLEGWLGPLATLFSGTILALIMLLGGDWLSRRDGYRTWAHALMGGGVALLYFLVYAAYHFTYFRAVTHLNPFTDILLLMAVVSLAIGLALRRNSQSLASRAFVLGFVTSLFSQDFVHLTLVYNLLLSLGLVAVTTRTKWSGLALMGGLGSWILHGIWFIENSKQVVLAQALTLLYFVLYSGLDEWLNPGAIKSVWRQSLGMLNILACAVLTLLAWQKLDSVLLLSFLLIYLALAMGLAFIVRSLNQNLDPTRPLLRPLHHGIQLSLGLAALYVCLADGFPKLESWFLLALGLLFCFLARHFDSEQSRSQQEISIATIYDALGVLTLVRLCFVVVSAPWLGFVLMSGIVLLLAKQHVYRHWKHLALGVEISLLIHILTEDYPSVYDASEPGLLTLGLHALTLVGLMLGPILCRQRLQMYMQHLLLWPPTALLALWLLKWVAGGWVSSAWAVLGTGLIVGGFSLRYPLLRYLGMVFLIATGLKVYFQDLSGLSLGYRIISLLVLGILLLGVALLYTRFQKVAEKETGR